MYLNTLSSNESYCFSHNLKNSNLPFRYKRSLGNYVREGKNNRWQQVTATSVIWTLRKQNHFFFKFPLLFQPWFHGIFCSIKTFNHESLFFLLPFLAPSRRQDRRRSQSCRHGLLDNRLMLNARHLSVIQAVVDGCQSVKKPVLEATNKPRSTKTGVKTYNSFDPRPNAPNKSMFLSFSFSGIIVDYCIFRISLSDRLVS